MNSHRERLDAIVLAGGIGERLRREVPDLPKPMAPVGGKPCLAYILDFLVEEDFTHAVLAVGYRADVIRRHFGARYRSLRLRYSFERRLLGTGGGIREAMKQASGRHVVVCNGDTFFFPDIAAMRRAHIENEADVTIACKYLRSTARYGRLSVTDGRVSAFREKRSGAPGHINGGVYMIRREFLLRRAPRRKAFSFERLLESSVKSARIVPFAHRGRFLDIGIPADYRRAERYVAR